MKLIINGTNSDSITNTMAWQVFENKSMTVFKQEHTLEMEHFLLKF